MKVTGHTFLELPGGQRFDPSLRDFLESLGAKFDDVRPQQVFFEPGQHGVLLERIPAAYRSKGWVPAPGSEGP